MQQGTRAEVALQPMTSETGATCSTFAASDPHGPAASRAERLTHHPQAPHRSPPPMRSCRPAVGAVTRSSRAPGPRHLATVTTVARPSRGADVVEGLPGRLGRTQALGAARGGRALLRGHLHHLLACHGTSKHLKVWRFRAIIAIHVIVSCDLSTRFTYIHFDSLLNLSIPEVAPSKRLVLAFWSVFSRSASCCLSRELPKAPQTNLKSMKIHENP